MDERIAWEWRAHALRCGREPLALFVWLMKNPARRDRLITAEDEREAGIAMQEARRCALEKETGREIFRLLASKWNQNFERPSRERANHGL